MGDVTETPAESESAIEQQAVGVVRGAYLLMLLPAAGFLMFVAAGALTLRAFAHNNGGSCMDQATVNIGGGTCTHYSYAPPIVLGICALVLLIGGGAAVSYFTARRIGVPAYVAMRRWSRTAR